MSIKATLLIAPKRQQKIAFGNNSGYFVTNLNNA